MFLIQNGIRGNLWIVKPLLCLICLMCMPAGLYAGPEGSQVVHGSADIVSQGNLTTIYQHTDQAILQHTGFDIAAAETVQFVQPNARSTALNRIVSAQPTTIDGQLLANGRVFLINPAGIIFGESAYVNTTQLVASALNLNNVDFLAGNYHFQGGDGTVVNAGTIEAEESVALLGKQVKNLGHIECPRGYVLMAAGDEIFMGEPGSSVVVSLQAKDLVETPDAEDADAAIENSGTIRAPGGEIALAAAGDMVGMAILNSGRLDTSSETSGGRITADGGEGTVVHTGSMEATNATGKGGHVEITGDRVGLLDLASIDASGAMGGGEVLIGGDYQGKGDTPTASRAVVDEQASIRADATENGDGGKVIVWADETAYFAGSISARGGEFGGDGGLVEVSGKQNLGFHGIVDTQAPLGATGSLLLDPVDILVDSDTVSDGYPANGILFGDTAPSEPWIVSPGDLSSAASNILLQASRDITFDATVGLNPYSLTAQAGRSIAVNANVTAGDISMTAGSDISVGLNATVTAAGDLSLSAGNSISGVNGANVQINMATDGSTLTLSHGVDLALDTFQVTNSEDTHVVFESTAGGVTSDTAGIWRSLQGSAAENIALESDTDLVVGGPISSSGGVGLVAKFGQVYTYGNVNQALDSIITGTADDAAGIGISTSLYGATDPAKMAVIILSGGILFGGTGTGALLLGPNARLTALGTYYGAAVDDRPVVGFSAGSPIDAAIMLGGDNVTLHPNSTISMAPGATLVIDTTEGSYLGSPPAQPWGSLSTFTSSQRLEISVRDATSLEDTTYPIPYASEVAAGNPPPTMYAGTYVLRVGTSGNVVGSVTGIPALVLPISTYFDVFQVIRRDPLLQWRKQSTLSDPMALNPPDLQMNWAVLMASAEDILGQPIRVPHIQCMEDVNDLEKYACIELDNLWTSDVKDIAPVFIERIAHRIVSLYSQLHEGFDGSQPQLQLIANSWQEFNMRATQEQVDVVGEVEQLIQEHPECEQWLDTAVRFAQTLYLQQGFTIDGSVQKVQETCVANADIKDLVNAYIRYRLIG